uniref:Uncharacterized protein n=1 Tax=Strigamia maritima TaxID=126957 RepID=T1JE60_STRMM
MHLIFGSYHSDHPQSLIISDNNHQTCIACLVDLCADNSQPNVKKHYFMNNLLEIFKSNRQNIISILQTSPYDTTQIITVFLNIINHEDIHLSNLSSEGINVILSNVKHPDLVELVLNTICGRMSANYHFQHYLPILNLAASLLNKFPVLVPDFVAKCENTFGDVLSALSYPSEDVKMGVLCFFDAVCKKNLDLLRVDVKLLLVSGVVKILKEELNESLLCNAMVLIQILIKEEAQLTELFQINYEGTTFPLLMKKMLLCQHTQLQIDCCQTLFLAMSHQTFDTRKADLVMQCDIPEILFEILATQNVNLIELIFNCIRKFCNHKNFFINCHVIFGIDPIFRCVEQLFACNSIVLLPLGLTREHLHLPIPFIDIQNIIEDLSKNVSDLFISSEILKRKLNKGCITEIELPEQLLIAKLSAINSAISLLQDCISDPSCFEASFKPPQEIFANNSEKHENSCLVTEFIATILEITYKLYIPVLYEYSGVLKSLQSYIVFLECLIKLEELSPKQMQEYFISLCKKDFLQWLWDLKRYQWIGNRNEDICELKKYCDHLLKIILTNLTYNFDGTEGVVPLFDLSRLNGNLNDCTTNLLNFHNSLWAIDNQLTVVHSTILAILYFNKLHSQCDVIKPINLLEILSNFIQNCPNLELIPHFTHKHLLLLFAISCEESNTDDIQKTGFIKPAINILSQLLQSYHLPLNLLYTHHESLIKWIFTEPQMANILGAPLLSQWMKRVENTEQYELSTLRTLLLCQNDFAVSVFLDLLISSNFSMPIWCMLGDLISNMDADSRCKSRLAVIKKFCGICGEVNGRKMNETTENVLAVILKILTHMHASDIELSDMKISKNVCTILPEISSCELISTSYLYLNNMLSIFCENGDNKVLTMILSQPKLMNHLNQICFCKSEHPIQPVALNLLADLIRHQFNFKTQVNSTFKLEFKQLQKMLTTAHNQLLQSTLAFIHSLLETSFKSPILNVESILDDHDKNFNCLRLLYIYLQNIAMKVDGVKKDTVLRCIIDLLTFVQHYNADLGTHFICQSWIGVLFEAHLRCFMGTQNDELKRLLYLFLEFPVVNKSVLAFVFKLLHQLTNSSSFEKDSVLELFEKLSRSSYYVNVKPKIEEYIRSIAVEE